MTSRPRRARAGSPASFGGRWGGRISVLHLNDAKNELGSRRDGHKRIGEGHVATEAWTELFRELSGVPVLMETPYATPEVDAGQVRLVKELAGGLPLSRNGV